jgi:hypothetical protein
MPPEATNDPLEDSHGLIVTRGQVIKATLRFNLKLALEGAKDLFLAPLSIGAGLLGLLLPAKHAAVPLQFVLRTGNRFDDAIDLYRLKELSATPPRALPAPNSVAPPHEPSSDADPLT